MKRIALVVGALLVLLAVAPFLIRADDYIPAIEKEMSARLDEPVSIRGLRASLFPTPHLTAEGIAIGAEKDVKIEKLRLTPALLSLVRDQTVLRRVDGDDLVLTQKALGAVIGLSQRPVGRADRVRIEQVRLHNVIVHVEHSNVGPLDIRVQLKGIGSQGEVTLRTRDDTVNARLVPDGERFRVDLWARNWTPPAGPPLRFDELKLSGFATSTQADLKTITGKLYGGTAVGDAAVNWEKGFSIKARLDVTHVEMEPLTAAASRETRLTGHLDAKPNFSTSAPTIAGLAGALRVEGPFTVSAGVLRGVKLANSRGGFSESLNIGDLPFDRLAGRLTVERGAYRFTQVNVASRGIVVRGNLTIAANKALSGRAYANFEGAARAPTVPLTIGGTLDAPSVFPATPAPGTRLR